MSDDPKTLTFACPHCGGPLHVVEDGGVECKHEHRFTLSEVLLEQVRTSSQATWLAVKALRERAQTTRWAAQDPELYGLGDPVTLERSAAEDERTAEVLQKQAQALDLTVWRLHHVSEDGGRPV